VSTPSLKVVVAITSPIAFHALNNQSILETCLDAARTFVSQFGSNAHLAVAGSDELLQLVDFEGEKIQCDPNSTQEFARSLSKAQPFELVMVHDSQRPLTRSAQFDRVFHAFAPTIDAVRPISAFTETLKTISAEQFVEGTIDRNSMKRISTPELIRYSAIDFDGSTSTWFVPLKADARIATIEADSESARINSEKEIKLMTHLLERN